MVIWPDRSSPEGDTDPRFLAAEVRRRLGAAPESPAAPLVSIVVVNRSGCGHLRRLFEGLADRTDYPRFELILVDNGSTDGSLDFARSAKTSFPLAIVANHHNESFSDANNQGAGRASGELLLFLNNDVEPLESGWLRELVACMARTSAGIVGATLIFPKRGAEFGYLVQHRAMLLRDSPGLPPADMRGHGEEPFADGFGEDADSPVPTGACMLVDRTLFERVGGFTHGFFYGGEDLDLGLKAIEAGRRVVCSGRSLLIHRFGSTRAQDADKRRWAIRERNERLLWERWGARLRREYELDRLSGGGTWASPSQPAPTDPPSPEQILKLGFCLRSAESRPADEDILDELSETLVRRSHSFTVLRKEAVEDPIGFNYDAAVHLRGPARYVPRPSQLNVLWAFDGWDTPTATEGNLYDLILSEDRALVNHLKEDGLSRPAVTLSGGSRGEQALAAILARAERLAWPTRIGRG